MTAFNAGGQQKEGDALAKREVKSLLLRLSPEMWDAIGAWAEDEFRSVNGQIEYVLREALVRNRRLPRDRVRPGAADADAGAAHVPDDAANLPHVAAALPPCA